MQNSTHRKLLKLKLAHNSFNLYFEVGKIIMIFRFENYWDKS